jgi:hypothetical protein
MNQHEFPGLDSLSRANHGAKVGSRPSRFRRTGSNRTQFGQELYEQVLVQSGGCRVTLLTASATAMSPMTMTMTTMAGTALRVNVGLLDFDVEMRRRLRDS